MSSITLRRATQQDQDRIKQIIHAAGINPNGLAWQRFLVAESEGIIVGTGQIKPHSDGSRELASIAVVATHRHRGIASQVICALLEGEKDTLYLMCNRHNETFYHRFGFQTITSDQMPRTLQRIYRVVRIVKPLGHLVGHSFDIIIMCRKGPAASSI